MNKVVLQHNREFQVVFKDDCCWAVERCRIEKTLSAAAEDVAGASPKPPHYMWQEVDLEVEDLTLY